MQKAQTLQEQIRILFINAVTNGCPEAVLEDFVASVMQEEQDESDTTFSVACVNAYVAAGNTPSEKNEAAFKVVTEKQKPLSAVPVDSNEMLPGYNAAIEIFSDSRIGNADDLLRALKSIQRTAPTLKREQARELLTKQLPVSEDQFRYIQTCAIQLQNTVFIKLLYIRDDDHRHLWGNKAAIKKSIREILIALTPHLDAEQIERYQYVIEDFVPDKFERIPQFFALLPYFTDTQKRRAKPLLLDFWLKSVFEKDCNEITAQIIIRWLACASNPYKELQSIKDKKMLELLQKTLPYFVPHIPAQFLSKNKHLSDKDENEKKLNDLIETFNEKIAPYFLRKDKITRVNEAQEDLRDTFKKIILTACEERKLRITSFFNSKKSDPTFSTTTHSAKQLIQYFYSPESIKVREALQKLMPGKFPDIELTAFSVSLQNYMKEIIGEASKAKATPSVQPK